MSRFGEKRRQIAQHVSNRCKDLFKRKKIGVRCTLTINMQDSSIFFPFFFESVPDEVLATCKSIQMQTTYSLPFQDDHYVLCYIPFVSK